jgi:hypothetical protein
VEFYSMPTSSGGVRKYNAGMDQGFSQSCGTSISTPKAITRGNERSWSANKVRSFRPASG